MTSVTPVTPVTLTPQAIMLRDYLLTGKSLTNLIAIGNLGIGSATKRISELRAAGYEIKRTWKKDHHGKRYAEWTLGVGA